MNEMALLSAGTEGVDGGTGVYLAFSCEGAPHYVAFKLEDGSIYSDVVLGLRAAAEAIEILGQHGKLN